MRTWREPGLRTDLRCAERDSLSCPALDLGDWHKIPFGLGGDTANPEPARNSQQPAWIGNGGRHPLATPKHSPRECAEPALLDADVGELYVPVDHVGRDLTVANPSELVGRRRDGRHRAGSPLLQQHGGVGRSDSQAAAGESAS